MVGSNVRLLFIINSDLQPSKMNNYIQNFVKLFRGFEDYYLLGCKTI